MPGLYKRKISSAKVQLCYNVIIRHASPFRLDRLRVSALNGTTWQNMTRHIAVLRNKNSCQCEACFNQVMTFGPMRYLRRPVFYTFVVGVAGKMFVNGRF